MLENLCASLQATFTRLVGSLLEAAARERKAKTGSGRRTVTLEGPEPLESRITPSTADYWTATTAGDWNNAQNWTDDNGNHVLPTQSSDVYFGQAGTTGDCTMSVPGGVTVNSLTISPLYNHTLTLNTSLTTFTDLNMSSGSNIVQPNGTSSTITIGGELFWTGGTIGSQTSSASNLNLYNYEGTGTSVLSGSTVKTLGDNLSTVGVLNITKDFNNQLNLTNNANITNGGEIDLNFGAKGITNATGSSGTLTIYSAGTLKATGLGPNMQCIPIVNSGNVIVGDVNSNNNNPVLEISGASSQNGVSFYNNGGTTTIYTGAALRVFGGFTQQSGVLDIAGTSGTAFITGTTSTSSKVVINGGGVQFDNAADNLSVSFDFAMTAGRVLITVDGTTQAFNSITSNAGNITIAKGPSKNDFQEFSYNVLRGSVHRLSEDSS